MKNKVILLGVIAVTLLMSIGSVLACTNPPGSHKDLWPGAQKVPWHLSGAVMPVPPYGSADIPGSDTASKLFVNQQPTKFDDDHPNVLKDNHPNEKVEARITSIMNGLHPDTTYTVYLSNAYIPYKTGWDVTGAWDANFVATVGAIGTYPHHMDLTQTGSTLTGSGYYIPATEYTWVIDSGSVTGNHVIFDLHYTGGHPITWTTHVDAYIQNDGSLIGTWSDNQGNSGTMNSYNGKATATHTGDTGWPGLFTSKIQPFTFKTDGKGSGRWHINMHASDFPGKGTYKLSVWINGAGATILVSDNFQVKA